MNPNNDPYAEDYNVDPESEFSDILKDNNPNPNKPQDDLKYSRDGPVGGDTVNERPTIDTFFYTEALLLDIEKSMSGYRKKNKEYYYVGPPVARTHFINTTINALRSVINPQNMLSSMTEADIEIILLEKNKEFIYLIWDEPSVWEEMVEPLINMFDHALQLFMGLVAGGFGSESIRQMTSAMYQNISQGDKSSASDPFFSFGLGDKNILSLGGDKR